MTRKNRRLIFYSFFLIFFIVGYLVAIYSMGWRFDFKKARFVATGAIYLETKPPGVKIHLNNKFQKETINFPLFSSVLFKNLRPDFYQIKVEKEGYFPWTKTLFVESKLVTEAKDIQLFLKNPKLIEADFSEIKIEKKSNDLYFKKNGLLYKKDNNQEVQLTIETAVVPKKFDIINSSNEDFLILQLEKEKNLYFFHKEKRILEKIDQKVIRAQFSYDGKKIIYQNEKEIFIYPIDLKKKTERQLITRNTELIKNTIWINKEGTYLVFLAQGFIKIAEIDSRDQRNIIEFLPSDGDFLYTDKDFQYLYFLVKKKLYKTQI